MTTDMTTSMTQEQHKEYMEKILKELSNTIFVNNPKTTKREDIPVTTEEDFYSKICTELCDGLFQSPLQKWIESGKNLIEKEMEEIYNYQEKVEEYIEDLQDKINIAQIELNEELERLENLENLLETISI